MDSESRSCGSRRKRTEAFKEGAEDMPDPDQRPVRLKRTVYSSDQDQCPYFEPSIKQLKALWDFDNACAKKYGTEQVRHCRAVPEEENEDTAAHKGVSDFELAALESFIEQTWQNAEVTLKVIGDVENERPGLRLVVHPNMPKKLSLTHNSPLVCGWLVRIPEGRTAVSHLWERSTVKKELHGKEYQLYLGGPISYANRSEQVDATVIVYFLPGSEGNKIHQAKITQCKGPLVASQEITWMYNKGLDDDFSDQKAPPTWFLKGQCCYTSTKEGNIARRHERRVFEENIVRPRLWVDRCVLCGVQMACNNKERRAQLKPHLVRSHADYLGSSWNGYGSYNQNKWPIDGHKLLREADLISVVLQHLNHDLGAKVMPASAVFTKSELKAYENHPKKLMAKFREIEMNHIRAGCLILRGLKKVKKVGDLQSIAPMEKSFRDIPFAMNKIHRDQLKVPDQYFHDHQLMLQDMQRKLKKIVASAIVADTSRIDQVPDLGDAERESDNQQEEDEEETDEEEDE